MYCKAELPPQQWQDLKCMAIEKANPWCTNPSQLMSCIPKLVPSANKALRPRREEGAYTLAAEADELMHEANWNELFVMEAKRKEEEKAAASTGSAAPP